jgi:hypothetical protein
MTWTDFMKMCHEGPGLPREVLDEVARLDEDMPIDEDDDRTRLPSRLTTVSYSR